MGMLEVCPDCWPRWRRSAECGSDEESCHQFLWPAVTKCTALHCTALPALPALPALTPHTTLHCTALHSLHCSTVGVGVGVHWRLGGRNIAFFPHICLIFQRLTRFTFLIIYVYIYNMQLSMEWTRLRKGEISTLQNSWKLQKSIRQNPPLCRDRNGIPAAWSHDSSALLRDSVTAALQHLLTSLRCRLQLPGAATRHHHDQMHSSSSTHPPDVSIKWDGAETLALMTSHSYHLVHPMALAGLAQFVIDPLK